MVDDYSRLAHENAVLAEIGRIITSSLDIDEVYERFAVQVRRLIPLDRVDITSVDPDGRELHTQYAYDGPAVDVPTARVGHTRPLAGSVTEQVFRTGAGLFSVPLDRDQLEREFPAHLPTYDLGFHSVITVPLISKGNIIGFLTPVSKRAGAYTEHDLALTQRVADQIAGAVANAELHAERMRAQAEHRLLALVVSTTSEGVLIEGTEGHITFANRAAEEMYGYAPGEMLSMALYGLFPSHLRASTGGEVFEATMNDGSWTGEAVHERKNGEEFPVGLSTALLTNHDGSPLGLVCICSDISERKRLEGQVLRSQRMDAVGQLAGGIAHDFNNLLTVILSYAHLGQSALLGEGDGAPKSFQGIKTAAERGTDLTQQLLAFSRNQIIETRALSVNDLIVDMDAMLRRLIGEDVELVTIPALDLGLVKADPGQIEQVLANLAVNARDAMPDGGKLTIEMSDVTLDDAFATLHSGVRPGDYVMLAVSDTGTGMEKDVKEQIFEPFFTTKDVGEGTGLGLSTCYGIVSQIGGHLMVESEPNRGSTFRAYLPRVSETADRLLVRDQRDDLPLGSETVLLVDDEPMLRDTASRFLRERGYTVLEAANGIDALRMAEDQPADGLDLLITDVVMPLMGGKELAQRLSVQHPKTRVLLTSGYTNEGLVLPDAREPRNDFLPKPFTLPVLSQKVRAVLDKR